jgi:hypothetical protein
MSAEIRKEAAHFDTEDSDIMNLLIDGGGDINIQSTAVI